MAVVIHTGYAQTYKPIDIANLEPVEILPIIWQIEAGDKNYYDHIEHLRIAEATRIIDMMWKYGAGNHSPEEYQQLMMRLNTGMLWECPLGYNNYELLWWDDEPSKHAHVEWFILNTHIKHANYKVINPLYGDMYDVLYNLCKSDPNKINIMWISVGSEGERDAYDSWDMKSVQEYEKEPNWLVFAAGTNIRRKTSYGVLLYKIYQEDYDLPDEHSIYSWFSRAHNRNDYTIDRHLILTFGTNKDGDIDQTGVERESSKFPVGFHPKVLFSGRTLPYRTYEWDKIRTATWHYTTSFANYYNVVVADLCFQLFAEVKDVDELLEMIRSTAHTDYIRLDLNGDGDTDDTYDGQPETQPLILMNPGWLFQKYLMPTALPASINTNETITLEKGYYHGVIYQIPGAEVNINGQWMAFTDEHKDLILAQNPMTLTWRLNGDLLRKLGYKLGDTVNGKVIAVDDRWNGLNLTQDMSISVSNANGIKASHVKASSNTKLFNLNGQRVGKGYKGIVISNGRKTIAK